MKALFQGLAGGVLGAILVVSVTSNFEEQPPVATVDLGTIMDDKVLELARSKDQEKAKKELAQLGQRIDAALVSMSKEYEVPILIKPSVVAGAPDLTMELKRRLDNGGLMSVAQASQE